MRKNVTVRETGSDTQTSLIEEAGAVPIEDSSSFLLAKKQFDDIYRDRSTLEKSFVPVDGKFKEDIRLKDVNNNPNEEYYKWQFIYSLIASKLVPRDHIGVEIYYPKGNRHSSPIKIDAVIFDENNWTDSYQRYREEHDQDALDHLRSITRGVIEFKREDKRIEEVFNSQIKASIKESDASFVFGVYYDAGRLFLFKKIETEISRFDNSKNIKNSQRILERFQLEITDPYYLLPSLTELKKIGSGDFTTSLDNLKVDDLDIIYTINDENVKASLYSILRCMDSVSLTDEPGYLILIQSLAMKIYDEKLSATYNISLKYYINPDEVIKEDISNPTVQKFIGRMKSLFADAKKQYKEILAEPKIDFTNIRHIRLLSIIVEEFQRYSFIRSEKSDLYQLVFYNFATKFQKDDNAQFLTPLPIIEFMVRLVNPRKNETVCDPCCGIADFLSLSFVDSDPKLDDHNLFGFDKSLNMTLLAQLNMLLNGDGNATIRYLPNNGSIDQKLSSNSEIKRLDERYHKGGNWNDWPADGTELYKYDVILTNPPFGKNRSIDLNKPSEKALAEFYELYSLYVEENPKAGLDLGIVFLENAVRLIKNGTGRFGIILSNSIASNKTWEFARKWLLDKIRVVAIFDLPENVFAETGVNTTIIIGYKPKEEDLKRLKESNYSIFSREIKNVGYVKKTVKRNVFFEKEYLLDETTFETILGENGESTINEDFTQILSEFRDWCNFQEEALQKIFLE